MSQNRTFLNCELEDISILRQHELSEQVQKSQREADAVFALLTSNTDGDSIALVKEKIAAIATAKKNAQNQLSEVENFIAAVPSPKDARQVIEKNVLDFQTLWRKSTPVQKKKLLHRLFEALILRPTGMGARYRRSELVDDSGPAEGKKKAASSAPTAHESNLIELDSHSSRSPISPSRDQRVAGSSTDRDGRPPEVKGHFPSPSTYLIDTLLISELPRYCDRSFLQQKYVEENLPAKEIADLLGCSATTVKARLREFGLAKGGSGHATHKEKLAFGKRLIGHRLVSHKAELQVVATIRQMYVNEDLRPRSIASLLDTMKVPTKRQGKKWDHSVVIAILKREGIYKQSRRSPRQKGE